MPSYRLFIFTALIGLVSGWFQPLSTTALAQTMSASAGPQQMVPSVVPTTYPSTYPSTPSTYPSTTGAGTGTSALPPYDSVPSALMASVPNGAVSGLSPSASKEFDLPATPYGAIDASTSVGPFDNNAYFERTLTSDEPWSWQLLPNGLLYRSYLASNREPRFASQWVHEKRQGWLWDVTLGGRLGLVRYGTDNDFWPQGWQLDIEGAAFPRLDADGPRDVISNDYRFGIPLTTRQGPWEAKFGYYHLSSHIGDEYLIKNPLFPRINYVRESLIGGLALYLNPSLRLYTEAGWAFYTDGGAQPWEFQFGADFSSPEPTGLSGAPFFAINGHLRQENDFGGNLTVQTGWQWRGRSGHLCRLGMQYFNGMSEQDQFYNQFEEQIGIGLWYDY